MKFDSITIALRKTIQQKYEEISVKNDICEDGLLIINRTLHSRLINSWGRDEDTDERIYLNKNGWVSVITEEQYGAGPSKIISEHKKEIDDEDVNGILNDDGLTVFEFLTFIERLYKIREEYRSEFSHNL